jgi:myxalamid-type polyketide synthase MxaB
LEQREWLIIGDNGGVGDSLAEALRLNGEACVLARQELHGDSHWRGVVHLLNLDSTSGPESERLSPDELQQEIDRGCRTVLQIIQTIVGSAGSPRPPLWIVTRNAQAIDVEGISVAQSVVHGLRSVLALEHPDLVCSTVDLDGDHEIETLVAEINSTSRETQVAYRNGDRYVARLVHAPTQRANQTIDPASAQSYQLSIWSRGVLDNLFLQPLQRRLPGPGEIEIETVAAGVNFRDVLNAMGMYAGAGALGSECVGRIVALGEGVNDFEPGDEVIAFAAGSFSSFVTTSALFAFRKPPRLSYREAATIATPFLTAFHGLCNHAHISAGDRVLIHNAAGGVGQAALQIALQAGAEIYATASPGKWEFLRSLGVKHIANSRSLDFAGQVIEWTNGEGVDIVLNSLPGEFIAGSLAALKPTGHFVEIGKKDIWTIDQVAEVRPQATYSSFDLSELALSNPALIRSTFETIMAQFEQEKFRPLNFTAFPVADAVEAFRFMASAKHIGRVVLVLNDEKKRSAEIELRSDASYLITGGLGGLGLLTARWLVQRGARELILVGRNEPSAGARKALAELAALGARVVTLRADVSQQQDVKNVFRTIEKECLPLRGIIHAAGTLDDALLMNSRWEQFRTVMDP